MTLTDRQKEFLDIVKKQKSGIFLFGNGRGGGKTILIEYMTGYFKDDDHVLLVDEIGENSEKLRRTLSEFSESDKTLLIASFTNLAGKKHILNKYDWTMFLMNSSDNPYLRNDYVKDLSVYNEEH